MSERGSPYASPPHESLPRRADERPEAWIGGVVDGKYRLDRVLGAGGMGMVFEARRLLVGDDVALKVLFPRYMARVLQRRLFRDEAVAAARLSHPNVVIVYDASVAECARADGGGPAAEIAYIAMERLRGRTLRHMLRDEAPLSPEVAVPVFVDVARGLTAAHAARIVHRDLKPDNVFLEARADGTERVKLVDFGIAAMLDAERAEEERVRVIGTLRYMSPEQLRGEPLDGRADVYALGVMLYEALTRRRPFGDTVDAVLNGRVAAPNALLPPERKLPPALDALVMSMMARDRARRPSDAAAALEALVPPEAVQNSSPRPLWPRDFRPRRGTVAVIASVVGLVIGMVIWWLSAR